MSKKPTIKELEQKINELTEGLQRERADAQNLRRRAEDERMRMAGFYKAMVVQDLLPALDNLERALKHTPTISKDGPWKTWYQGVKGVLKQFEQCFSQLGVKRIKTVGEVFDPKLHEAVSMEDPSTSSGQAAEWVEVVCEELQPGYHLDDEVIRHAMVKVKMEKK